MLSRREMLQYGVVTGAGAAALSSSSIRALAAGGEDFSLLQVTPIVKNPPFRSWTTPFRVPPTAVPCSKDEMELPSDCRQWRTMIEGGTKSTGHQRISEFEPHKFYRHEVREFQHRFHDDWGTSTMWGFGDADDRYPTTTPGPVIKARYGEPILVRLVNKLPVEHVGFGVPEPTIHLHNGHTPFESDGNPIDFVIPGQWKDHFYPNVYAGVDQYGGLGDPREGLGSLWYHDHHLDHTAENVYAGLAGQYLLYDDLDTGDETTGLRLPSGEFDVPMLLGDVSVDATFQPVFDLFNLDGVLGDSQPVNGIIQPFWEVKKRRYRLRVQNAGPSRWYDIAFYDGQNFLPFWQISTDGNLLPQPVQVTHARLGVAQRVDIILDMAKLTTPFIYMVNRAEQLNGRGPSGTQLTPGIGMVKIIPVGDVLVDKSFDPSAGPQKLRDLPDPDFKALQAIAGKAKQRSFVFDRANGAWTVNGRFFNPATVTAAVPMGSAEVWTFKNGGSGWLHPVHIHFEEHRVLSRNGKAPPVTDISRKDVVDLGPGEEVKFFMRFRDFKGRYVMHCHNVVHEDHAMMIRWDIV
jgi:FtsP/CotA-like multicopper oxidase with cupredoxin domain